MAGRALVLHENEQASKWLNAHLRWHGFDVSCCGDVEGALTLLSQERILRLAVIDRQAEGGTEVATRAAELGIATLVLQEADAPLPASALPFPAAPSGAQLRQALEQFGFTLFPTSTDAQAQERKAAARARLQAGQEALQAGQMERAVIELDAAVALDPGNRPAALLATWASYDGLRDVVREARELRMRLAAIACDVDGKEGYQALAALYTDFGSDVDADRALHLVAQRPSLGACVQALANELNPDR